MIYSDITQLTSQRLKMKHLKLITTVIIIILCPGLSYGDIYYKTEIQSSFETDKRIEETFISGTKMKTLINGTYGWLIDLKEGTILDYDLKEGTYTELTIEKFKENLNSLGEDMLGMSELYQNEEDLVEEKKVLEKTSGPVDSAPIGKLMSRDFQPLLKKVRKKKEINGEECYLINVDISRTQQQEMWVTEDLPYTQEVINFWKAFYRLSSDTLKSFPELKNHFQVLSQIDGFVMSRNITMQMGVDQTYKESELVKEVSQQSFDEDMFVLPKNLRKV